MNDTKCKPPACEYSIAKEKCVKPNPYFQYKSKCSRDKVPFSLCVNLYNADKKQASEKACDYYKEYLLHNKEKLKKIIKDGPKKVGRPKKEPKEPKAPKEPKEPKIKTQKTVKEPKEPKEPKIKTQKTVKEPKIKTQKTVKEPKEPKAPKTQRKKDIINFLKIKSISPKKIKQEIVPKKIKQEIVPKKIKQEIVFKKILSPKISSSSSPLFKSFVSSSSIKAPENILRKSSSSFNITDKSSVKTTSSMLTPSNPKSLSKSLSISKSKTPSSKSTSFKSLKTKSSQTQTFKTARTKTPSDILEDIKNIQEENKEIEEKIKKLIKETKRLHPDREEFEEINAKKIGKYLAPLIDRISTIENRIKFYRILHKYIETRNKYKNNCIRLYKYDKSGKPIYRIGNRVILEKKIGTDSVYGAIYLSHYRLHNKKFGKLLKFATKISDGSYPINVNEYTVLKDLTACVIRNECPHFPISYGKLTCSNQYDSKIQSVYSSDINPSYKKQSEKSLELLLDNLPENANKSNIIITLNELAENDIHNFIKLYYSDDIIIWNTLIQIMLSIMFFYKYINAFHCDAHSGNFLYHKIKPGGYFHYNLYGKDFYLENIGFLIVIWDFGLINPFQNSKRINNNKYGTYDNRRKNLTITQDYAKIIKDGFRYKKHGGGVNNNNLFSTNIYTFIDYIIEKLNKPQYFNNTDTNDLETLNKEIITILKNYPDDDNTFKNKLTADDVILNPHNPYYL